MSGNDLQTSNVEVDLSGDKIGELQRAVDYVDVHSAASPERYLEILRELAAERTRLDRDARRRDKIARALAEYGDEVNL